MNLWSTTGYQILKLSKIREHKENEVHQQAQRLELQNASQSQPNWITKQIVILPSENASYLIFVFFSFNTFIAVK